MGESFSDRVSELETRYYENKGSAVTILRQLRENLIKFSDRWVRDMSRRIAINENHVTVDIGKKRLGEIKAKLGEFTITLPDIIDDEFSRDPFEIAGDASSGMVRDMMDRYYDEAIRHILGGIGPILRSFGYLAHEDWSSTVKGKERKSRYPYSLDLPSEILQKISDVIELVTENKVIESKIVYFRRQSEKERARRLWDAS